MPARQGGERALGGVSGLLELARDQFLLAPAAVLRELPARLEPRHLDLEVHDAVEHLVDVFRAQGVEFRQPLWIEGSDQLALVLVLALALVDELRNPVGVNRRVVPGRHPLLLLIPARRHVGVRTGEHHHHLVVEELLPLRVVLRHVHVEDDVLVSAYLDRQMGCMKRAASAGDEQREAVAAHELHELRAVLQPVVARRIHYSSSAIACAAMPSRRPMKPSCSVVVALMLIAAGAIPRSAAMLAIMRSMCGAMRGACARMFASTLMTLSLFSRSFCATSRSSPRLSAPAYAASVSG